MKILIIAVFLAVIPGIKKRRGAPLPREFTQAVCGICACLIMLSHTLYGYDVSYAWQNYPGQIFIMDQLVVAPFLFISGWGVFMSIRKNPDYARAIPRKKILPLYLRFALVNTCCVLLAAALKIPLTAKQIVRSYCCLGTVLFGRLGSCSWFIGVMIILYLIVFYVYLVFRRKEIAALTAVSVLTVLVFVLLRVMKMPSPWWDTILVFPLGMWTARFSVPVGKALKKSAFFGAGSLLVLLLLLTLSELGYHRGKPWAFLPAPAFLCCALTVLSVYLRPKHPVFAYCGKRALYLYLVQEPVLRILQQLEAGPLGHLRSALPFLFRADGRMNLYVYALIAIPMIFFTAELFARLWDAVGKGLPWKKKENSA